jgi:hypothetical protein
MVGVLGVLASISAPAVDAPSAVAYPRCTATIPLLGPGRWFRTLSDRLEETGRGSQAENAMTYFPDLSPYTYRPNPETGENAVNVGWLDAGHEYPKGDVHDAVQQKILVLCRTPVNRTRGFHPCPICNKVQWPLTVNGEDLYLGSAEIWVRGRNGQWYAAPDIICHYIRDHRYRPPEEFVRAVEDMDT